MSDTYITNQPVIPPNQNDVAAWKQAYIDLYALGREATDDYLQARARIAELEAIIERMISDADSAKNAYAELEEQYTELEAQLAQTWQPLPDGEYSVQTFPSYHLSVQGSDLAAWWSGSYDMEEINVGDYRLCRLVERAEVQPNGWKSVNESLPEGHAWVLVYADGAINCMGYSPDKGFEDWTEQQTPNVNISEITHWKELQRPTEVDHE